MVAALRRLEQGGLVAAAEGGLVAYGDGLQGGGAGVRAAGRRRASRWTTTGPGRGAADVPRDGRLVQMPAARGKRRVVLEHIVAAFEPGVRYPEREVDAILRAWHDDHAALRRYLVDEGLLARERGVYWRIGGLRRRS